MLRSWRAVKVEKWWIWRNPLYQQVEIPLRSRINFKIFSKCYVTVVMSCESLKMAKFPKLSQQATSNYILGHIWTFLDILGHIRTFLDILGHIWTFWDIYGHFGTYSDISGHIWTFWDINGHFGTYSDISGHINFTSSLFLLQTRINVEKFSNCYLSIAMICNRLKSVKFTKSSLPARWNSSPNSNQVQEFF
jgi:hypothetical protein